MAFKFKSVVGGFVIVVMIATLVAIITMLLKLYMVLNNNNNNNNNNNDDITTNSPQHQTKKRDDKIVGFVHFHKAGGTSVVSTFAKYMNLWEPNYSGNPWRYNYTSDNNNQYVKNMSMIPIWRFNDTEFVDFIKQAKQQDVDFIAMEWNFFMKLKRDEQILPHMQLVTCIRDPYDRFVSNLYFDTYTADEQAYYSQHPIEWMELDLNWANHPQNRFRPKWQDFQVNYNKPNYYTSFLSGLAEFPDILVNETHLEIAKHRLQNWFSSIIILDIPDTHLAMFNQFFPEKVTELEHKNKGRGNNNDNNHTIAMTRDEYYKYNMLDKELYDYAVELATASA